MKAHNGQTIVDLYVLGLAEQPSITEKEIGELTKCTMPNEPMFTKSGIQFRMDTEIKNCPIPVCQYVTVTPDGEIEFREAGQWFISSNVDRLFNTFTEILEWLRVLGWLENELV